MLSHKLKGTRLQFVCRILKFSDSSYNALGYIADLEEQGRRGDRILIRGMRTGSAKVSARLADPAYEVTSSLSPTHEYMHSTNTMAQISFT